jgi:hypothetical protein
MVDAKFGKGSFEESQAQLKPHRCAGHLEDCFVSITTFEPMIPCKLFFSCVLFSTAGNEPSRVKVQESIPFGVQTNHKTPLFNDSSFSEKQ